MGGIFVLSTIIAISVMRSESLSLNDSGVCSETNTSIVLTSETFKETYTRRYTSCDLFIFIPICSTKYRIALRTKSRSVYRVVENDILTCCPGYIEVEDKCMSEATTAVITTQSPLKTSAASTSRPRLLSSTSTDREQLPGTEKSIFSNIPAKNESWSPKMILIISGVGFFVIIVIIGVLALVVFFSGLGAVRKRGMRPETTSSPLQNKESRNDPAPNVQYYSEIPENQTGYSSVALGASPQHPTPSTISEQPKENKVKAVKKSEGTYKAKEGQHNPGMETHEQRVGVNPQLSGVKYYKKVKRTKKPSTELYYDELDSSHDLQTNRKPIYG